MRDLLRPGIEPVSPALTGRFLIPGSPGRSSLILHAQEQSDCSLGGVKQARGGGPGPAVPGGPQFLRPWGSNPKGPLWLGSSVNWTELVLGSDYKIPCQKRQRREDRGCAAGGTGGRSMQLPAIPGQNPESGLGEGPLVDPGLQAPGPFRISTKGGKQAGTWGMPLLLGSPLQDMIEVSRYTSSGAHISYQNRLSFS